MKYFIAFMLLLLTNCLESTAISAATNPTNVATHAVVLPAKKLSFKQKLLLKLSKSDGKKIGKARVFFLIGALLLILGFVLFIIGMVKHDEKAAKITNPNSVFAINLDGLQEGLLGTGSMVLGLIALLIGHRIKKKKAKRMS